MSASSLYFDYQAGTPLHPEVREALLEVYTGPHQVDSGLHRYGIRGREALARARESVASFLNVDLPESIVFTSGLTESNNLAVRGAAYTLRDNGKHIVTLAGDHPSVLQSLAALEREGFQVTRVRMGSDGRVDMEHFQKSLIPGTIIACVHLVNHEIGVIQPVSSMVQMAHERGIKVLVDAGAAAGWIPVDVQELKADWLTASSERFYGPSGGGILYVSSKTPLQPLLLGGRQEGGRRAGVVNLSAAIGAGVAARVSQRDLALRMKHTVQLQRVLWQEISQMECVVLNGPPPGPERVGNNLHISAEFVEGEALGLMMDMKGVAVASGPGCIYRETKISHVLEAIGLSSSFSQGSVLFTWGLETSDADIRTASEVYRQSLDKLRRHSPLWEEYKAGRLKSTLTKP